MPTSSRLAHCLQPALGVVCRTPVENGRREHVVVDLESLSPVIVSHGPENPFAGQDRQHGSQRAFVDVRVPRKV